MNTLDALTPTIDQKHRDALAWFAAAAGQDVKWSDITGGTGFPITTQKGIYKPAATPFALSIRQAEGSGYGNKPIEDMGDGGWRLDYFQEGHDPATVDKYFTNRALFACQEAGVPIGVIVQTRRKPVATYRIEGLATVTGFNGGFFRLERFVASVGGVASISMDTPPVGLEDARERINIAIALRQGRGLFRAQALKAYGRRCAICEFDVEEALEAAHIVPYLGAHTNVLKNTLLLRADLHTLFDRQLFDIHPDSLQVQLSDGVMGTAYGPLHGRVVRLPKGITAAEIRETLLMRREYLSKEKPPAA